MDCGLVKLIVTVPELEWGGSDNATWDDQPYKHDNNDVRYKPAVLFVTVASGGIIPQLTRFDIETRAGLNRLLVVQWSNTAGRPRVIVRILVR